MPYLRNRKWFLFLCPDLNTRESLGEFESSSEGSSLETSEVYALEVMTCCKRVETTRTFVLVVDTAKLCSTRHCRVMFLACCFLACCINNTDLVRCLETHLGLLCRTRSWRVLGLSS